MKNLNSKDHCGEKAFLSPLDAFLKIGKAREKKYEKLDKIYQKEIVSKVDDLFQIEKADQSGYLADWRALFQTEMQESQQFRATYLRSIIQLGGPFQKSEEESFTTVDGQDWNL